MFLKLWDTKWERTVYVNSDKIETLEDLVGNPGAAEGVRTIIATGGQAYGVREGVGQILGMLEAKE